MTFNQSNQDVTLVIGASQSLTNNSAGLFSFRNMSGNASTGNTSVLTISGNGTGGVTQVNGQVISDGSNGGKLGINVNSSAGVVALGGVNTFSGGLTLTSGTLTLQTNTEAVGTGVFTLAGGVLNLNVNATTYSSLSVTGTTAINITANRNFGVTTAGASTTTGAGTLNLNLGGFNLNHNGAMDSFTGAVNILSSGAYVFGGTGNVGSASARFNAGENGTFQISNLSTTSKTTHVGELSGGVNSRVLGSTTVSEVVDTLSVGGLNTNSTFAGQIMNGTGHAVAVTKVGSGTLTLSGSNSYTGNTLISQGTLLLSGSNNNIASSAAIEVASGAHLNVTGISGGFVLGAGQTLRGNGTVDGALTVGNGAILAVGNSPGSMTFADGLTLAAGSISNFEINGLTAGLYDVAQGDAGFEAVAFDGTLNLIFASGFSSVGTVKIFDFDGYSGAFAVVNVSGLASGYTASFNALTGEVSVVPEPSTCLLFGLGMGGLLWRLRTRRTKIL